LSKVAFHSYAPGSAGPSTFSGSLKASSPEGSWITTISLDLAPDPEKSELLTPDSTRFLLWSVQWSGQNAGGPFLLPLAEIDQDQLAEGIGAAILERVQAGASIEPGRPVNCK